MNVLKRRILAAAIALTPLAAHAQGIPVFDTTAIAKQLEQIAQLKSQLDTLKQQLAQGQKLFDSMNGLTDMSNVAGLLNDPAIRNALPADFSQVEGLLKGNGGGAFGSSAQKFLSGNSSYTPTANDFYSQELVRLQKGNAGQMALGEQMYDAATKRIAGIDELRRKISTSADAKEIADLSARLQAETAYLQTDTLRMQALQMVQEAQAKVQDQRAQENWRQTLERQRTYGR